MDINLSTDAPPSPERTVKLAETLAEIVRVLDRTTMHREALRYPAGADRVLRELSSAAGRLPQLLDQIAGWVAAERAAGRITVPDGEYAGRPDAAAMAVTVRLERAMVTAAQLQSDIDYAARITCNLGGTDDRS